MRWEAGNVRSTGPATMAKVVPCLVRVSEDQTAPKVIRLWEPGSGPECLSRSIKVGRCAKKNDVVLRCPSLPSFFSRRHARFDVERGDHRLHGATDFRIHVTDLGGLNGTYLNSVKLESNVGTPLSVGDVVSFGKEDLETGSNGFVYRLEKRDATASDASTSPGRGEKRQRAGEAGPSDRPCCSSYKMKDKMLEDIENHFTCTICQDFLVRTQALVPCGHMFCKGCLGEWFKRTKTCPMCRQKCSQHNPMRNIDCYLEEVLVPLLDAEERKAFEERVNPPADKSKKKREALGTIHQQQGATAGNQTEDAPDIPGFVYVPNF